MIYLDHAATTPMETQVVEAMLPYFTEQFGNPSTQYRQGQNAKKAVNAARRLAADFLGAKPEEITFTGGGTESDNWALQAVMEAGEQKGKHLIVSAIEHDAVLHTAYHLKKRGYELTVLPVDERGLVCPKSLQEALRPDTVLVSIMLANNEIGTIEPIRELAQLAHAAGALFHTDAVQAFGHIPVDVNALEVDLLSASAHKIGGPKGVGLLYHRDTLSMGPFLHGGGQESGRRSGTENVPGIVGFGKAIELAKLHLEEREEKVRELARSLKKELTENIPLAVWNGAEESLPGIVSLSIPYIEAESLLVELDMKGICCSGGSACATGSREPSHVMTAIGAEPVRTRGTIRISLSHTNTMEEMHEAAGTIARIAAHLRELSPEYRRYRKETKDK